MKTPPTPGSPGTVRLRNALGAAAAVTIAGSFASSGALAGLVLASVTVVAAFAPRGAPLLGQLAARSYFLLLAAMTAPAAMVGHGPFAAGICAAALVALLAPDPEPLRAAADRAGFTPLASRDGFLVAATVAMSAAAVLTLFGGFEIARSSGSILGWASLGLALAAGTGVVATLQMRAVGFVALATAGATSSLLAVALLDAWVRRRVGAAQDPFVFTSFAMGGAAFSTVWVPLLVARQRARLRLRLTLDESESPREIYALAEASHGSRRTELESFAGLPDAAALAQANVVR